MGAEAHFGTYHLTSAAHNARIAGEAEIALEEKGLDGTFRGESLRRWQVIHDSHVITSFISSFAGVEAAINEFIQSPFDFELSSKFEEIRSAYPGDFIHHQSTLAKFQLVLLYTNHKPFDKGSEPYQSINLIRQIRNYFTHHEPEYVEVQEGNPETRLGRALQTKNFDLNPFREDEPFFPGKCISHGCAKLVLDAVLNFLNEFYSRMDTHKPYGSWENELREEMEPGWTDREPNWGV